ncbi:MAG: hypothetical protein ACRDK7_08885 [Solirubrobacteraceae bacterium]
MKLHKPHLSLLLATVAIPVATVTGSALATRILNVHDEGRLRFVTSYGSELIDEGPTTGSVPGRVKVHFIYNGDPNVRAKFTIYAHGGSISGRGKAKLSSPTSPKPSFHGSFAVIGGSGRYAHVTGAGQLYGVFTRRGYGLVVQTIGKLLHLRFWTGVI